MRLQTLYEGRWIFLALALAAAGAWAVSPWLAGIPLLGIAFCINFFRDPARRIPADPKSVVSAADGLVTAVEEADAPEPVGGRARRVSVFLSVFDVHVNRAPVAGRVMTVEHRPGTFLDARAAASADRNEAMTWVLESAWGPVAVRQITGAIARRIVAWSKPGEALEKGHRFGMIRFGSRTDVFLPLSAEIMVEPGDRVKGGETIIARMP